MSEQQTVWYAGKQVSLEEIEHANKLDRRIVAENTRVWWHWAHTENTAYHQQFQGYCPSCRNS